MDHIAKPRALKHDDIVHYRKSIYPPSKIKAICFDSIRENRLNRETELDYLAQADQPTPEQKKIIRAIQFIKRNFNEEITLDDIASTAHLSTFHFSRIFKRETGQSPYQYLSYQRINESKKLLSNTTKSIAYISSVTGYNSPSGFSSAFKQIVGVPPKKYRKAQLKASSIS